MMAAVVVALAVAMALLSVLVVGLLRSHAEILRALHDLGVNRDDGPAPARRRTAAVSRHAPMRTADGVPRPRDDGPMGDAADLTGRLPQGGAAHVAVVGVDHPTLLAFLSTGCGTCGTFWEALGDEPTRLLADPSTRVVVITNGPDAESPAAVADLAPAGVTTVMSSEAWDDYRVPVSPYFILVDGPSGRVVGEGAGSSWEQVIDLLGKAEADAAALPSPPARALTRMGGQDRADRVDQELRAAGIEPGDPSLYPTPHPSHVGDDAP
jgi:hypothetical protein